MARPCCMYLNIVWGIVFSEPSCYLRHVRWRRLCFHPLSVCLFFCVTGYLKKLWTDPDEILWTGLVCDKDELIRFWWRSRSGSDNENFWVILHHWEIGWNREIARYLKKLWTDSERCRPVLHNDMVKSLPILHLKIALILPSFMEIIDGLQSSSLIINV